jgi:hypothetical protein
MVLMKFLGATMAMFIIFVGWFSFTIAGSATNNQVVQQLANACFPGGLCAAQFASRQMGLFEISIGVAVFFVIMYMVLAVHQDEPDTGMFGE